MMYQLLTILDSGMSCLGYSILNVLHNVLRFGTSARIRTSLFLYSHKPHCAYACVLQTDGHTSSLRSHLHLCNYAIA